LNNNQSNKNWDLIITPKEKIFNLELKILWNYRDLLLLFVRRDIVSFYKQTLLGPLWYFIQPIFTTIVYTFVFGSLAGISTDGLPKPLFFLAGITSWNYFSDCLIKTSTTFRDNASIFGKVYFPRIISPLSIVISNLFRFGIQMILFGLLVGYYLSKGIVINCSWKFIFFPYFVLLMGLQGLGLGMIITALTTKYRDLSHLVTFGVQLMMYTTTVVYPLSNVANSKLYWLVSLNPMTFIIEGIKFSTLGVGILNLHTLIYSTSISLLLLLFGILIFNKVEKTFIDTI
jgi:lipopolysaccharide transport system permease protein